jgi:hypothetical protein
MIANINNQEVNISSKMVETLERLAETGKGRFATVMGYVSTTGYTEPQTADINFTSRFSYENLLVKKLQALEGLTAQDVGTDDIAQFDICKEAMIASAVKTLEGDRSDSYREAHDTFYIPVCNGVKIHLKTVKNGKETQLVIDNAGNPIADSIMVSMLETGRKVIVEGVRKEVKNGPKVLMDKKIQKVLKEKGVKELKTLSLKEDNFVSLRIDNEVVTPEQI